MKKGWIIYNGFLPGDKFIDFAKMLEVAARNRGHHVTVLQNAEVINEVGSVLNGGDKTIPDYVLFTDKDIYLAKQLEQAGIPVFNSAKAIEISDDKIKTYQQLNVQQLPIPKTIVAPKQFGIASALSPVYIDNVIERLGLPLVVKEAFGSFGEQVYLVEDREALIALTQKLVKVPYIFQAYIKESYGRDIRLQVVGDEVISAMIRTSNDDFRANVTTGGKMAAYTPTEKEQKIAVSASKAIGADFSGVDLLFGKGDEPIICEVNSNAHIRNLLDCTGVNAADAIVAYVERAGVNQCTHG